MMMKKQIMLLKKWMSAKMKMEWKAMMEVKWELKDGGKHFGYERLLCGYGKWKI